MVEVALEDAAGSTGRTESTSAAWLCPVLMTSPPGPVWIVQRAKRRGLGTSGRSLVGCPCFDRRMDEVVVGALVQEGRVLLVHRRPNKRANPDVWDLPGGVIEAGESELDALTRELHEELGVRIATGSATHLCRLTAGPADEPALLSAWLVSDWRGTPANAAPEEHDDIAWFSLEELPPPPHVPVRTALVNALRSPRS